MAERRKDAVVANAIILALPEDCEISGVDRIALVRVFARSAPHANPRIPDGLHNT
jgi:hypothetical protein